MKLIRLSLQNFRGCKALDLVANGADVTVFGDNATGKTTLADAFTWVLFGKDSAGRTDFAIKPIDPVTGEEIHHLDSSVELVLEDGAVQLVFKKVYREKWETKRGAQTSTFTGHTTEHFVNGVPRILREYQDTVARICDERQFRLLTDPTFFHTHLKWQDRRIVLLDLVGQVTDAEVIASAPDLAEMEAFLGRNTHADHLKIVQASLKAVKAELEQLPARIDQETKGQPVLPNEPNPDVVLALQKSLRELQGKRADTASGTEVQALTLAVRSKENEIHARLNELRAQVDTTARTAALAAQNVAQSKVSEARNKIAALNGEIRQMDHQIAQCARLKEDLRAQHQGLTADIKDLELSPLPPVTTECPTCQQALPGHKVEAARAEYNRARSEALTQLGDRRQEVVSRAMKLTADIQAMTAHKAELEAEVASEHEAELRFQEQLSAITIPEVQAVDPSTDARYLALCAEKQDLESQIARMQNDVGEALRPIDEQITKTEADLRDAQRLVLLAEQVEASNRRIKDIRERIEELGRIQGEQLRQQWLCEEFARAKGRLLESRLNTRFTTVRWRLFDEQMNGGISETCTATVNGVEYSALNHGMQVNAGLDIIAALSTQAEFAPPIFIDNAESVTAINPTPGQQIRLVVSAADKALRIETPQLQGALL